MNASYYQCFKVFIASPGDVAPERRYAEEAIHNINNALRDTLGIMVDCLNWEGLSALAATPQEGDVQDIIIDQLVEKCNAFVLILNKRYGTVASEHGISNTEREINAALRMLEQGRNIMFLAYFCDIPPDDDPGEEERKVRDLRERLANRNLLYKQYDTPESFRDCLTHDLYHTIIKFIVSTSKRRALSAFWQLGIPEGETQPSLAIVYPPLDRADMRQEEPDQFWLRRLVPNLVFEDFRAVQKLEKTLRLIGFRNYDAYSVPCRPNDIEDRNRVWICAPRNGPAGSHLERYEPEARFRFIRRVKNKPAKLFWRPMNAPDGFIINSPLSRYLQEQRREYPGGEWRPEHGRIVAKDYAILARFTDRRQRCPMVEGTLKDYFLAGIRGLGTWGAGWFIDRRYNVFEQYAQHEDATIQLLLEVTYRNDRILDVRNVSDAPESYFSKEYNLRTIRQYIKGMGAE